MISKINSQAITIGIFPMLLTASSYFAFFQKQPHYRPIVKTQPTIKPITIRGEVVDAWCYASQTMGSGKGLGHKACALNCINGGVSAGILEDGTDQLYVAAKYKGFSGCKDVLLPYIGEHVLVTGWVGDKGGCRMLRIDTIKPADPAPAK